jgi:PHD/YefM family antitoxin component YafN of YafNO toxin-antitoxin module
MHKALPVMPLSDLCTQQIEILSQLEKTPILITQHDRGVGVLVHPDTWNKIVEQLEHLLHLELLRQRSAEIASGDFVTFEELECRLAQY